MGFVVKVDTREKSGWWFPEDYYCDGSLRATLKTGDYTIVGWEDKLTIDRKGKISELCTNLVQPRFEREMERMASFETAIILMEFTEEEFDKWPYECGLSKAQEKMVRTRPKFLRKKMYELSEKYNVIFTYGGANAKEIAYELFRSRSFKDG